MLQIKEMLGRVVPRKAVGEMIPVRFATSTVVPDSRKGAVKSTAASLSAFTFNEVRTMSNFLSTKAFISPFHFPFWKKGERLSENRAKNFRRLQEMNKYLPWTLPTWDRPPGSDRTRTGGRPRTLPRDQCRTRSSTGTGVRCLRNCLPGIWNEKNRTNPISNIWKLPLTVNKEAGNLRSLTSF